MILFLDAAGDILATNDTAHPAPEEMLARLREGLSAPIVRIVDLPPIAASHWHFPDGSDVPVLKPEPAYTATKREVVADEIDATVLGNLPAGAVVEIIDPEGDAHRETVDESGVLALSFAAPGPHLVRIHAVGHRATRLEIAATAPVEGRQRRRPLTARKARGMVAARPVEQLAAEALAEIDRQTDPAISRGAVALALLREARDYLGAPSGSPPPPALARLAEATGEAPADHAAGLALKAEAALAAEERRQRAAVAIRDVVAKGGRRHEITAALDRHGFDATALRRPAGMLPMQVL